MARGILAGVQWSPRPIESIVLAVAGLAMLLVALGLDPAGRLLVGAAGVFVLGLSLRDALIRPRLAADEHGLTARAQGRRLAGPWAAVTVRVREGRRFGANLEIDVGDKLAVLGRRELGAPPLHVAEELLRLRSAQGGDPHRHQG
ncbi:hypothetical protein BH20ACT5_BH20ACT5_19590 [soil metagenome]